MVRFAQRWPAERIAFKFASLGHGTEAVALDRAQKIALRDELIPAALALARTLGIQTDLEAFRSQISLESHRTAPIEDVGCFMGTIYCRITVDGELLYCCNREISVGLINAQTSFRDLWESHSYRALRTRLQQGEYFESCQQCGKYKENLKWSQKIKTLHAANPAGE
jgi:hypothetical protein